MSSTMTRFLAITFVLSLMVSVVRTAPADHSILLKKNSDNPQWDDLGWAWGKRSSPVDDPEILFQRYVRSLKAIKKNPDWHDLGWAWGRK